MRSLNSRREIVSPRHPLASYHAPIPATVLAAHIQLIHMNPADVSPSRVSAIQSARFWRLSHLGAKLAFLRAGFGYCSLPLHVIDADLASGALVPIMLEDAPPEGFVIAMSAIYRTESPPRPAGRWFMERLKQVVAEQREENASPYQSPEYRPSASATIQSRETERRRCGTLARDGTEHSERLKTAASAPNRCDDNAALIARVRREAL
jgi:hypothetical protein